MARLNADLTIEFDSVAEFLGHYDSHMSKGGFYLDSEADWQLRQVTRFTVTIAGEPHRAEIDAEVVYCGGGKVGLQMAADRAAVAGLVHKLRSAADGAEGAARGPLKPPALKDDGTILYDSVADFLADYEANITSGGLYVESARKWPLGSAFSFLIRIRGQDDFDFPVRARTKFAEGGLVGLQLEADEEAKQGMDELVELLLDFRDEPPPDAVPAEIEKPREPVCRGLIFASRDAAEFGPIGLFEVRPDVKPQTTLFGLMASLARSERPLRLEMVNNEISLSFVFKSDGSLVEYSGPNSDADLFERLARASFIDRSVLAKLKEGLARGRYAPSLLAENKAVTRQQVLIAQGEQVIDALESIRAAGEVPFRVFEVEDEWEDGITFGTLAIPWMDRALKALSPETVKGLLKPMWKKTLKLRPGSAWPISDLALDDEGRRFTSSLDGKKPLNQAVGAFEKRHRDKLFRLAIALRALGTVDVLKPAGAAPGAGDKLAALTREVEKLVNADKFEQAGVHWSAHPNMYARAMQEIQREYGRSSNLARSSQQASKLCQRRVEMAKRAHEYLSDDFGRQEYRRERFKQPMLSESAQLLFRKAQAQISDDNPRAAVELLEMAVELDDHPEYRNKLAIVLQHLKK